MNDPDTTKAAAEETVGAIVAEDYRTAPVFERHGIDFCCGGTTRLDDACRERGLDPEQIKQELAEARRGRGERKQNFAEWGLPFLSDYIINIHHAYLNENLSQIAAYTTRIAEVHGRRHPELLRIAEIFGRIARDMTAHLAEEEEVLFPAIRRIDAARRSEMVPEPEDVEIIRRALESLEREHREIGDAVHAIRDLSGGYAVPEDACNTFLVTYRMLREFEEDLHMHVHLENNILFPRAARL